MIIKVPFWLIAESKINSHIKCSKRKNKHGDVISELWNYEPNDKDYLYLLGNDCELANHNQYLIARSNWIISHKREVIQIDRFINFNPYYVKKNGKQEIEASYTILKQLEGRYKNGHGNL